MVDEEKQVVAGRGDVPIRRRSGVERGGCRAGDYTANVTLVLVEGVGYRARAHEHNLRDRAGRGRVH